MDVEPVVKFRTYPFETDESYQAGLQSMLQNGALEGKSDDERDQFLLSTRLFYFNRVTGLSLRPEDIRDQTDSSVHGSVPFSLPNGTSGTPQAQDQPETSVTTFSNEPRALSFAEIKELIEQGKTDQIPNNRLIPDVLSTDTPSESKAPPKRKPWEI